MIIDDAHEIAFVHIPKCAGTTIRQYLQPYDRSKGKFTARVDKHDQLGMLDYVHIPLFVLKEYFPEEFEAIKKYWSFAVIRDPFSRFASSVSQRLKMYGEKNIQAMSDKEIRGEINKCVDFLRSNDRPQVHLPHDYIHFQRQVDYIYVGEERIVNSVFATDRIEELIDIMLEKMGEERESHAIEKDNSTLVYRNMLIRTFIESAKPFFRLMARLTSRSVKERIRGVVYVGRDQKIGRLFSEPEVRNFVAQYYRDDIALFDKISG